MAEVIRDIDHPDFTPDVWTEVIRDQPNRNELTPYPGWINEWLIKHSPDGMCGAATQEMKEEFPELTKVRGWVEAIHQIQGYDLHPHWWLVDPIGNIVDPTATQFSVIFNYRPRDESVPCPTGKCPNCGMMCYNGDSVCSDRCRREYTAYLNSV